MLVFYAIPGHPSYRMFVFYAIPGHPSYRMLVFYAIPGHPSYRMLVFYAGPAMELARFICFLGAVLAPPLSRPQNRCFRTKTVIAGSHSWAHPYPGHKIVVSVLKL